MKNAKWIFIVIAIALIVGIACYFFFFNNQNSPAFPGTRMGAEVENNANSTTSEGSNNSNNEDASNNQNENSNTSKEIISATEGLEKEISKFSTKIMDEDEHRDNNMEISLSKLNGKVVKNEETFSFNETVGSPTPNKGYEKAGVFVEDEYKKDYGGGNCQVSTTLYNAVLKVDGLKVTERHEHTQEVYYVPHGKDAAVAYGEIDFKFENNTGHDIKIYSEITEKEVKIRLTQI